MPMIKKAFVITSFILSIVFLVSCSSNENSSLSGDIVNNPNTANGKSDRSVLPAFTFTEEVHDFGKIIEGESVSYDFKFKNSGKSDLLISDVSTSCGCTVPTFTKEPIRPGQSGVIKVTFSSAGKRGFQSKTIVIVANTQPNTTQLRIKALVVSPGSEK
jgi:hypothetical protein